MRQSAHGLLSYTIGATDGDIGGVYDLYFDDQRWTIRYLVVDTGTWLPGRRVLISPMAVREPSWSAQRLAVALTKAQVEGSPSFDAAKPVSRQHEIEFAGYYGYPLYWAGPYLWGPVPYPMPVAGREVEPETAEALRREGWAQVGPEHRERGSLASGRVEREEGDPHLRSVREVLGYAIQAADGEIGHVEDFILDDETWTVRYLVVDTRNWWPGKKVLVSPEWIDYVSWADSKVHVNLTRHEIRDAPEYDPARPIERADESRLYEHYQRPKYWEAGDRDRAA